MSKLIIIILKKNQYQWMDLRAVSVVVNLEIAWTFHVIALDVKRFTDRWKCIDEVAPC